MTPGFSLIEILISLFILSVMLLGLDALQLSTMQYTQTSYYLAAARQQAKSMGEWLRAYRVADAGMLERWNQQNAEMLPQGQGVVTGSWPAYKIAILWGGEQSCEKTKLGKSGCYFLSFP